MTYTEIKNILQILATAENTLLELPFELRQEMTEANIDLLDNTLNEIIDFLASKLENNIEN